MQPLRLEELILLYLCHGELNSQIWFGVEPTLVVEILLGSVLIGSFIRGIFLPERKVVLWHSQPVTILIGKVRRRDGATVTTIGNLEMEPPTHTK